MSETLQIVQLIVRALMFTTLVLANLYVLKTDKVEGDGWILVFVLNSVALGAIGVLTSFETGG